MQQFCVGGCIRDVLLDLNPKDIDYVWTGITPDFLLSKGMLQVGNDFPVFLDKDGNEHALARTERKTGSGYNGFVCHFNPDITIEQDLERRDLTINSMAVKIEDWNFFKQTKDLSLLIDPYNGLFDLQSKVLKPTSDAFAEDPIRVLRIARFAARYNFKIPTDVTDKMRSIVHELNDVPSERIWTEFNKGLSEEYPDIMFLELYKCGVFELDKLRPFKSVDISALQRTTKDTPISYKFTVCSKGFLIDDDYDQLSIPGDCKKLSVLFNKHYNSIVRYLDLSASDKLNMFMDLRVFNDVSLLESMLNIMRLVNPHKLYIVLNEIMSDIHKIKQVNVQEIVNSSKDGQDIKRKLFQARSEILVKY